MKNLILFLSIITLFINCNNSSKPTNLDNSFTAPILCDSIFPTEGQWNAHGFIVGISPGGLSFNFSVNSCAVSLTVGKNQQLKAENFVCTEACCNSSGDEAFMGQLSTVNRFEYCNDTLDLYFNNTKVLSLTQIILKG